jgi:hypothetical protein
MDRLVIERLRDSATEAQGILGTAELYHPAGIELWSGFSIELPWRDNVHEISCVPEGIYVAEVVFVQKFNMNLYLLKNVPNRTSCLIHVANWAGDVSKGFRSDVEGCTGLGEGHGMLTPPGHSVPQLAVTGSGPAIEAFMKAANGAPIEVEYKWKDSQ